MEYGAAIPGSRITRRQDIDSRIGVATSSALPTISPTRGFIRGNKIVTNDQVSNRRRGKKSQKEFDQLLQALNDSKAKSSELENQNMRLQTLVLEGQNELSLLARQYSDLYEKYSMIAHLEKWGDIIREKNEEIQRQQERIRKMVTDRAEALNDKKTAEGVVDGLKSKLRKKNREIIEIKTAEKMTKKATVLSETESLRNDRQIALSKLAHRDVIIEKLKLELKQSREELFQQTTTLHDTSKRETNKDRQIEDLKKNHVINRFKMAASHALQHTGSQNVSPK